MDCGAVTYWLSDLEAGYETPVRYIETDGIIQCFTSKSGKWWRSVAAAGEVTLLLKGVESAYKSSVIIDDPERVGGALRNCLSSYPQDAVYHAIAVRSDGSIDEGDFQNALADVVLIELVAAKEDV